MKRCGDCIIYDAEHGWCLSWGDRSPKDKACDQFVEGGKKVEGKKVKECCATCKNRMKIVKYDYSKGGCQHTDMEGFACESFVVEGVVVWMVGVDPEKGMCECYMPKRKHEVKVAALGKEEDCFTCVHSSVTDDDKLMCSIKGLEVQHDWKCDEWKGE